ncbi:MAG: hypothetical protein JST05_01230 [Acidobacteria bacterium]|nr:hypothetical protein [Acidobacteriota bacterium]
MNLVPMTKLVPIRPHEEPALESAVEGVSIYRAARADARSLHKLIPGVQELLSAIVQGHLIRPDHPSIKKIRAALARRS